MLSHVSQPVMGKYEVNDILDVVRTEVGTTTVVDVTNGGIDVAEFRA